MFDTVIIDPKTQVFFDDRTRDMCRSCKRYGSKATCPPYVENLEYYKNTIRQYQYGQIIFKKYLCSSNTDHLEIGKTSSLELHHELISRRTSLYQAGYIFVVAYGGGSCKLCETCSFPCKLPQQSLVALEAAGINVFLTLDQFNVKLPSLITDYFYRVGAVFYG